MSPRRAAPILLLGPVQPGGAQQERWVAEFHRLTRGEEGAAAGYASVIVINDGGADTAGRLLAALRLCRHQHVPRVGVLSYLDEGELQRAVLELGSKGAGFRNFGSALRIELHEGVLSLEYQAD